MAQVLFAENGLVGRDLPVDAESGVEDADACVGFGVIEVVALVLEHGRLREYGESVCEPTWNEQLAVVFLRELHRDMLSEGG